MIKTGNAEKDYLLTLLRCALKGLRKAKTSISINCSSLLKNSRFIQLCFPYLKQQVF